MMWWLLSVLILSMIDASVVDLPEPVGPVTRIRPRGLCASRSITGGSPRSSEERRLYGMGRDAPATAPRCTKTIARERGVTFTPDDTSGSVFASQRRYS